MTALAPDLLTLTFEQAQQEWQRLAGEITQHDRRYYLEDAPTISERLQLWFKLKVKRKIHLGLGF